MSRTSFSLLERLRMRPDADGWRLLVELYLPLIQGWLRRHGVGGPDADDLAQEVLTVVAREVGNFQHNGRTGAFRNWLRTITVHRIRDFWRARKLRPAVGDEAFARVLDELEDASSSPSVAWDQEHDRHVARRLMELIRPEFGTKTWRAFERTALDGARAAEVAAELRLSVNAVLIAKSRVLQRLRAAARGLVD
jgi:RNA polymerase sigma-70 factor, ECF subfamily